MVEHFLILELKEKELIFEIVLVLVFSGVGNGLLPDFFKAKESEILGRSKSFLFGGLNLFFLISFFFLFFFNTFFFFFLNFTFFLLCYVLVAVIVYGLIFVFVYYKNIEILLLLDL